MQTSHMTYNYAGRAHPAPYGPRWGFDMNHLYSLATLSEALNMIDTHSIVASAIF